MANSHLVNDFVIVPYAMPRDTFLARKVQVGGGEAAVQRLYCQPLLPMMTDIMTQLFDFIGNNVVLVSIWMGFLFLLLWDNKRRSGATVSTSDAIRMINKENAVVLDIREQKDFSTGHIANAMHIPYASLATRLSELNPHKEQPIILVCKSGQTVGMAGKMLREKGFNAIRMQGGMMEWTGQSLPVVRK